MIALRRSQDASLYPSIRLCSLRKGEAWRVVIPEKPGRILPAPFLLPSSPMTSSDHDSWAALGR